MPTAQTDGQSLGPAGRHVRRPSRQPDRASNHPVSTDQLAKDRRGRAGWEFTPSDFWIEEHGLIMEAPEIPIVPSTAPAARKFIVTGDRSVTTVLTVEPNGAWKLDRGTLHDVTHLPCRSARYTGATDGFKPSKADEAQFPVQPGGPMPPLPGCAKQDYFVVFVVGIDEASL
jgi:hypothetical protein